MKKPQTGVSGIYDEEMRVEISSCTNVQLSLQRGLIQRICSKNKDEKDSPFLCVGSDLGTSKLHATP